jgi:hypothetical protein
MVTAHGSTLNQTKLAQVERVLSELLADSLRRGFFGTATIELAVQDGTIQHIRRKLEQIEK